jgi:SAM-dependent methyltransferase
VCPASSAPAGDRSPRSLRTDEIVASEVEMARRRQAQVPEAEFARLYDLEYDRWDEDHVFWQNYAASTGGPLVELGCGTGRALVPLAQAGYYVIGIDSSPAMLERAAQRFQASGIPPEQYHLLCQPMEAVDLPLQAGLVFTALNSFAHLTTPEQQVRALRAARALLKPRGRLILDLFNPLTQGIPERDALLTLRNVFPDAETGCTIYQLEAWQIEQEHQLLHVTYFYDYVQANGQVRRLVRSFPLSSGGGVRFL